MKLEYDVVYLEDGAAHDTIECDKLTIENGVIIFWVKIENGLPEGCMVVYSCYPANQYRVDITRECLIKNKQQK